MISIHAAHAGCDSAPFGVPDSANLYFNPRSPCGLRLQISFFVGFANKKIRICFINLVVFTISKKRSYKLLFFYFKYQKNKLIVGANGRAFAVNFHFAPFPHITPITFIILHNMRSQIINTPSALYPTFIPKCSTLV